MLKNNRKKSDRISPITTHWIGGKTNRGKNNRFLSDLREYFIMKKRKGPFLKEWLYLLLLH